MRLTSLARRYLERLAKGERDFPVGNHALQRLAKLGFAERVAINGLRVEYRITSAGRAALKEGGDDA